ncbi:DNA mismatch repair endonuclease MutL [Vibrio sp. SM6]|uniref:DNA mismatch repair protein MutL n=1 Tax=Vibrio agarilyticus TaxID=2726741 RepID=A0A7X8TUC5_9VIBR|nr:DNA mismatch repair endonuclease MutL [Vibrio agarilyticus]
MAIQILPARLANQIAAGEVVERPASVVKELVENSIDSGATRIDIDIEKGGAKLIRVRDNGSGIAKDELGLALSRHATSKIHSLDDLEAIISLGFRGEALASISSVSRLTLTSRPATQEEAWSAYAEGRDMAVKLQPSAHPVGTTVEVLDLFFNTPARRKFLRTEKTEFTHIDELLKRIALSRFDVAITLRHNGKVVRQYRIATNETQKEKRLAAVCGAGFVRHMLAVTLEHQGLSLKGWIATPEGARQQSDLQYCYVNGRMMRDKLINHAIRQSYESNLRPDQYAAYVLYIELDPHQVDVNVHPAKHEVRFHQARLVHDFIYQALASALAQGLALPQHAEPDSVRGVYPQELSPQEQVERQPETGNVIASRATLTTDYQAPNAHSSVPETVEESRAGKRYTLPSDASHFVSDDRPSSALAPLKSEHIDGHWRAESATGRSSSRASRSEHGAPNPSKQQVSAYQELMRTPELMPASSSVTASAHEQSESVTAKSEAEPDVKVLGKAVAIIDARYALLADKSAMALLSLARAEYYRTYAQLTPYQGSLKSQPLLVPLSLAMDAELIDVALAWQSVLEHLGIALKSRQSKAIMVMGVPAPLRQQNLQLLLPDLVSYLALSGSPQAQQASKALISWLANRVAQVKSHYTLSEAIHLIGDLENLWQGRLPFNDPAFVTPVNFAQAIARLASS